MILDSLQIIFLFGLFGFFTNWIAYKRHFYHFPPPATLSLTAFQLLGVFAIYCGVMLLVAPILVSLLYTLSSPGTPSPAVLNVFQGVLIGGMITLLFLFCRVYAKQVTSKIWKDRTFSGSKSVLMDFGLGMLTWFLSFPLATIAGQFFDLLIYLALGMENYEQVAVRYLRTTLNSPSQLVFALLTIVFIAPCIEEFLFRGCLQNYFKTYVGAKPAILLSAAAFSLFHFSSSQGAGNFSLLPSLFIFACFLGFIYERQRSLFASIGLHLTFNLASSLRILFFPEG